MRIKLNPTSHNIAVNISDADTIVSRSSPTSGVDVGAWGGVGIGAGVGTGVLQSLTIIGFFVVTGSSVVDV